MNIYNSVILKKLYLPPSDPKMHCELREKLEASTYLLTKRKLVFHNMLYVQRECAIQLVEAVRSTEAILNRK